VAATPEHDAGTPAGGRVGPAAGPLVEVRAISKHFGGVHALADVSVAFGHGTVHGLVGENGAGKSTLAKAIGGVHQPNAGEILVDDVPVRFSSPRDALERGIALIAQEIALVPDATVEENIFLGVEPRRAGMVNRVALRRAYRELEERVGFGLPAGQTVGRMRVADRQKVEIMRALARHARMILMDEPTAALTADETERLLDVVRMLSAEGTTIVLVSHYLDEVLAVSETVTVMRDARVVRTGPASAETAQTLVSAMVGREVDLTYPPKALVPDAPVVLEARGLCRGSAVRDVSFAVRAGEIVGLAGLVGAGRTETARLLFGADRLDEGQILLDGEPVHLHRPLDAIRHGIAMVPESRKDEGLLLLRSIRENITLATLSEHSRAGFVLRGSEERRARALFERLDVRSTGTEATVGSLSGGNQQKVLFARWLARTPRLLIVDEPTRGVDVAAKGEIHRLLVELAAGGLALIVISSEIEEVLGLVHRTLALREGRVVGEFGPDAEREHVLHACFGQVQELSA
jgi:ABC-type sugar transport system ATPase subunit